MGEELKSCPFCGGEASKRLFYKGKYRVHCNVCDAHSGDVYDTEAVAVAAWNTRAERTCKQVLTDCDDGLMPPFTAHCSACGDEWGFTPNYCPNCGAKVTGTRDERKAVGE